MDPVNLLRYSQLYYITDHERLCLSLSTTELGNFGLSGRGTGMRPRASYK